MPEHKFKLRLPEGYDLQIEFVEVGEDDPALQNQDAVPIETDDQGNLAWNGCGCGK